MSWVNTRLKEGKHPGTFISDLHADLRSGVRLLELIESIAPIKVFFSRLIFLLLMQFNSDNQHNPRTSDQERDDA